MYWTSTDIFLIWLRRDKYSHQLIQSYRIAIGKLSPECETIRTLLTCDDCIESRDASLCQFIHMSHAWLFDCCLCIYHLRHTFFQWFCTVHTYTHSCPFYTAHLLLHIESFPIQFTIHFNFKRVHSVQIEIDRNAIRIHWF